MNHSKLLKEIKDRNILELLSIKELKTQQLEIIDYLLKGINTCGNLPTSFGKSACYLIPTLIQKGLTIVVMPIIALQQDQLNILNHYKLNVEILNSTLTEKEKRKILAKLERGEINFLFATPETLLNYSKKGIKFNSLNLLALDECHTSEAWGYNFRTDYKKLHHFIYKHTPKAVFICSASIDLFDIQKLKDDFCIKKIVYSPFNRTNLNFIVKDISNENRFIIISEIKKAEKPCVVFCQTINRTEAIYNILQKDGLSVEKYYGTLRSKEKLKRNSNFLEGRADILLTTSAWGLGINKQDLRTVIHIGMPPTLCEYYQESGRVGRDEKPSKCILLLTDTSFTDFIIEQNNPPIEGMCKVLKYLNNFKNKNSSSNAISINNLSRGAAISSYEVRKSLKGLKDLGCIQFEYIYFQEILQLKKIKTPDDKDLATIYENLNADINLFELGKKFGKNTKQIKSILIKMKENIKIQCSSPEKYISFRVLIDNLDPFKKDIEWRKSRDLYRKEKMLEFIQAEDKHKFIREYFCEPTCEKK